MTGIKGMRLRGGEEEPGAKVDSLTKELAADIQLDNTFIFFTSGSGFLLGEYRIKTIKGTYLYEEPVRIPLGVRGPGALWDPK